MNFQMTVMVLLEAMRIFLLTALTKQRLGYPVSLLQALVKLLQSLEQERALIKLLQSLEQERALIKLLQSLEQVQMMQTL
jgi:hypothetical protein